MNTISAMGDSSLIRCVLFMLIFSSINTLEAEPMSPAKKDVESLMNDNIGLAEKLLREHGEFFPYGTAMKIDGEIINISAYDGQEQPPSQDLIDLLNDAFMQGAGAGDYKATALFFDVRVAIPNSDKKGDAVAVALDHMDDYSVVVYFPYEIQNGEVVFGDLFTQRGESMVFGNQN